MRRYFFPLRCFDMTVGIFGIIHSNIAEGSERKSINVIP
jgi:hypothetical protein